MSPRSRRAGKKARRARCAREQGLRAIEPENSLHHHGATARTGKQLAPPWGHRTYRKTACITAGPPHVPENSLHHHEATARTGTQLAPPRGHRTYRNTACTNAGPPQAPEPSWRSVEAIVFPDSAFRFLSRQVTESGRSARSELHSDRYAMKKRECRER